MTQADAADFIALIEAALGKKTTENKTCAAAIGRLRAKYRAGVAASAE